MSLPSRALAVAFVLLLVAAPAANASVVAANADRSTAVGTNDHAPAPPVPAADVTANDGDGRSTTPGHSDGNTTANATDGTDREPDSPKLSAALRDGRAADAAESTVATAAATGASPVTVIVEARPGAVESVESAVRALGGRVDLTHGDALQATVPANALERLADRPGVAYVREPHRPETAVVSEGVGTVNATGLHERGITGENVTVGVVDIGGFNLSNPELADVVAHRSYHEDGIGNATTGDHGTATAALISDVAPEADVVAVRVENYLQAQAAVAWLRQERDVDVVSMSLAWKDVGPLNGTAPLSTEIARSTDAGTPYFVATGNAGNGNHWDGSWTDPDGDGWLNFDGGDELMTVASTSYPSPLYFTLQWDDWPTSDEDYDLYVYRYESDFDPDDPGGGMPEVVSNTTQSGTQEPLETFSRRDAYSEYYVAVRGEDADPTTRFTAFGGDRQRLTPSTAGRSVTEPGVAPSATTVGAVDAADGTLEPFSSRGPTVDGRQKPDLVAPDNVSTGAYASRFYGTSAAAPHAAGVAALMLGVDGGLTPSEVETTLAETATPVTGTEPDNRTGYGLVDAGAAVARVDTPAPRPEASVPGNVTFGDVAVNETVTRTVEVSNPGDAPLSIGGVEVTGADASAFTVTGAPDGIAPGGTGTVTVEFVPASTAARQATLSIRHDGDASPTTIGLTGAGVGTAALQVPASVSFGDVTTGSTATRTVEVSNPGDAPLSIGGVEVTGADASAFTVTGAPDGIAPGGNGTVTVRFAPTATGARQATLSISHDGDGSPTTAGLTGTGIGTASVQVPDGASFGDVAVGETASRSVTVSNPGDAPLSVTAVDVSGPDASAFAVTGAPDSIAPGETGTVTVEFAPASRGGRQATLSVSHDGHGSPATVGLAGAGVGTPELGAPANLTFGDVAADTTQRRNVTVENTGSAPLALGTVGASGAFAVLGDPTGTLEPGATTTITVRFAPTSVGTRQATLSIGHNGSESPTTVGLAGTGVGTPVIQAAGSVTLGDVTVGEATTLGIEVTNPGTAPASVGNVTVTGTDASAFSVTDAPDSVAPGGTGTIAVQFAPTSAGARQATLSITHNGSGSPTTVQLAGAGVEASDLQVPGSVAFGDVAVNATATRDVTVTNPGSAPVSVSGIAVTGTDASAFAVTDAPDSVAPGGAGTVTVEFTPATAGARQATMSVAHGDGSTATVGLAGAGVGTPGIQAPDGASFGDVAVGETASRSVTVTNPGTAPLSVGSVDVTGPNASAFAVTGTPDSIAPGETGSVTVEFGPTAAGAQQATLSVNHDADGSPATVGLAGTGVGTATLQAPASVAFGDVGVGTTQRRNVTVENTGSAPLALGTVGASDAFAVVGDPTGTIAPGETRAVGVDWSPTARSNGSVTGTLTVAHDGPGSTTTVALSGRAVAPDVTLSAGDAARENVTANVTYDVAVRNGGTADLRVSGVGLADAAPGYALATASNASFVLAPGAERTLAVAFAPNASNATGERAATVQVSHNASAASPAELRLTAVVPESSGTGSDGGGGGGDDGSGDGSGDGDDGGNGGGAGGGGGGADEPTTDFEIVPVSSGATVLVEDGTSGSPVEAETAVSGAGVTVDSLGLAFRFDVPDFRVELDTPTASAESVPTLSDATPVAYFRAEGIGLDPERLDAGTVELSVSDLPEGASPEDVVVYRLADGSWTPLETTHVGDDSYRATTGDFTAFAVGVVTDTPTPTASATATPTTADPTDTAAPAVGQTGTADVAGGTLDPTETTGPGFGALVALLAVVGALLLARQRRRGPP